MVLALIHLTTAVDLAHTVQLPLTVLTFLAGSVMPLLVALAVHAHASARLKATANAVLSALAGALTAAIAAHGQVVPWTVVFGVLTALAGSVTSYKGLLNPTGAIDAIARAVPGGIGTPFAQLRPPPATDLTHAAGRSLDQITAGTVHIDVKPRVDPEAIKASVSDALAAAGIPLDWVPGGPATTAPGHEPGIQVGYGYQPPPGQGTPLTPAGPPVEQAGDGMSAGRDPSNLQPG